VSSHRQITGYFVRPDEYEEIPALRGATSLFAPAELPDEKACSDPCGAHGPPHDHLNALLDSKNGDESWLARARLARAKNPELLGHFVLTGRKACGRAATSRPSWGRRDPPW